MNMMPKERTIGGMATPYGGSAQTAQRIGPNAVAQGMGDTDVAQIEPIGVPREALQNTAAFMQSQGYPKNGPWCGQFAAAVVKSNGGTPPKNPAVASNWRNYGTPVSTPRPGDIAVRKTSRFNGGPVPTGQTGSHVTFVNSIDPKTGQFVGFGGNQKGWQSAYNLNDFEFRRGGVANLQVAQAAAGVGGGTQMAMGGFKDGRPSDALIAQLVRSESGGDPNAVSSKGAEGVFQQMPATRADPGYGVKPLQGPADQERFTRDYLTAMYALGQERMPNDPAAFALGAYNAGPGRASAVASGKQKWPGETKAYLAGFQF
jgi:uncharacterized protein (TIGR02594 family)